MLIFSHFFSSTYMLNHYMDHHSLVLYYHATLDLKVTVVVFCTSEVSSLLDQSLFFKHF
jgi:hypothetical protein